MLGLLNARLDWHGLASDRLGGAVHDRFEDELLDAAHRSDDGKFEAGARGALFVSGAVRDIKVLFRYDSERDPERRLFRDIRPNEGYDLVGDASVHGFDTQSADRLFARIERGASSLLYGDYATPSADERQLGAFSRRLNGGLGSLALGPTRWDAFASQGRQHQVIDEFAGQGTSGPYALSHPDGTLGSEQVELLTRDRNQPGRIVSRVPQLRYVDYTLEPFTGRLLFRHPIASIDANLNPVFIRVTYELESGGDAFWVYGGAAHLAPFKALALGGSVSRDEDPLAPRSLVRGDATLGLGSAVTVTAEVAQSDSGGTIGSGVKRGRAGRVEAALALGSLSAKVRALHTGAGFDNPSAGFASGREEYGFDIRGGLGHRTVLFATGIRTRDLRTDGTRDGAQGGLSQRLWLGMTADLVWRWERETTQPATPLSKGTIPSKSNTVGGKLTVPIWHRSSLFVEGEQDVTWYNRHRFAGGADLQLTDKTHGYIRHENVASLSGPYALNDFQQREQTVVGLSSDELANGHVYSEFRLRDAVAGREGQAAVGLRNRWRLGGGVLADAGFERVVTIRGGTGTATALTSGLEYTGSPLWKGTVRNEWRRQDGNDQWLSSATTERKLSRDWAALGRTEWFWVAAGSRTDGRSQLGLAYRGTESNRLSALMRYENRIESQHDRVVLSRVSATAPPLADWFNLPFTAVVPGQKKRVSHVVSSHVNWQPSLGLTLSGQLAGKWATDDHDGLFSRTSVKLLAGRALFDITRRFDVGASGRSEFGGGRRFGLGSELGWLAAHNLRLAAGYNVFGFRDADMIGADRTDRGPYLDFGYKFDPFWGGRRESDQGGSR